MSLRNFSLSGRLLAAILVSVVAATDSSDANDAMTYSIQIGGTGAGLGTMRALARAFSASRTDIAINVVPSLGSSGGVRALVDGAIDVAVTSRPLKPEEAEDGLRELRFARSPFVLVTSHGHPDGIDSDALSGLFSDPAASWSDGTPIRIILRPESESNSKALVRFFSGMEPALAAARRRPEVPTAPTDQDNIELAQRLPGSLTAASLTQIVTESADLRAIPLDAVEPTLENLQSGLYPLHVDFFLVVRDGADEAAASFVAFVKSEDGRRVLRRAGNLSWRDIVGAN